MDPVFLRRVVARRLVIGAAIVPDDDVALAPPVSILTLGLDHGARQLVDHRVALGRIEPVDPENFPRIEVERLALGLRMRANDRMEDGLPVAVFLVQERGGLAASAVREGAQPAVEPLLQTIRQGLVGGVHAGEQSVAAAARNGQRVELRRLERLLVVGAVGMPALGAAAIDRHVERAVRGELVDAEQGDLRIVRMARHLRRVRGHEAEATTIGQEVGDLELLTGHHDHVVIEPRAIDPGEARVVELSDVDSVDFRADLRPDTSNLDHRLYLLLRALPPDDCRAARRGSPGPDSRNI